MVCTLYIIHFIFRLVRFNTYKVKCSVRDETYYENTEVFARKNENCMFKNAARMKHYEYKTSFTIRCRHFPS